MRKGHKSQTVGWVKRSGPMRKDHKSQTVGWLKRSGPMRKGDQAGDSGDGTPRVKQPPLHGAVMSRYVQLIFSLRRDAASARRPDKAKPHPALRCPEAVAVSN
jgi:hypothetical protein